MRYVRIEDAVPGMVLCTKIVDDYGRVLIGQRCELTANYIERLTCLGYPGVYIEDEISRGIEVEDVIDSRLRIKGMECVKECNILGCRAIARDIVADILEKKKIMIEMTDLRSYDNYTYAHSVNVAVISCIIGIGFNMNERELSHLVEAGLMHDIGKLKIPNHILNKNERLTPQEYELMKSHAELSYEMLSQRMDVSSVVKNAVRFHHENVDGSGYPRGLRGEDLTIYARILHVADVYDALVSKRPYKRPYSPYEACEYLMGACGIMFDKRVVEKLMEVLPFYPKGTRVVLSNGEEGIIYDNTKLHNLRPLVRLKDGTFIDLMSPDCYNITIVSSAEGSDETNRDFLESEEQRKKMIGRPKKYNVLLVDNDDDNLEKLREMLCVDYNITIMKSGHQVLSYLDKCKKKPDLILMDIDMPQMDGIKTARRIVKKNPSMPIMYMTGLCDRETVLTCKSLNAVGYILRPYKPVFVKSEVKRILTGEIDIE